MEEIFNSGLHEVQKEQENEKDRKPQEQEFKFSSEPSIERIRTVLEEFVKERNWEKYHTPRNLLLALVGEVGELSEIFQWKGEVEAGLPNWAPKDKEHLEQELSDVFIYLLRLAQVCNVDLPKAVETKIEMNKQKYPVNKFYGSNKKYNDLS